MRNVVQFPLDGRSADHLPHQTTGRRRLFASGVVRRGTDGRGTVRLVRDAVAPLTRASASQPEGPKAA